MINLYDFDDWPFHKPNWDSFEAVVEFVLSGPSPRPRGSLPCRRASPRRWRPPSTTPRTPTRRSCWRTSWSSVPGRRSKLQFGNFTSSPYLRRTPLDRKLCPTIAGVLIVNNVSCKTKVSNFYHVLVSNKTISSCQISMDVVVLLKICHASTHLIQKLFMRKHIIVYVNM